MIRVFGIELRRSAAIESTLMLAVIGILLLFFAGESEYTTGWMQLAMTQRLFLALLWPMALAAGAWQGRRESRTKVAELFASTPRPGAHRTVPTMGAMAVAVICAYLLMGVAGGIAIAGHARYLPAQFFAVVAVGLLSLVAAVWLGLAIGRLLPWPVTAPALGVAGLGFLLLIPAATRPDGWRALVFSPIYEMNMPDKYQTVPGPASVSQTVWLVGLAVTALLLFALGNWRLRIAALLPAVLGATLAVAVMPRDSRYVTDAVDPAARELVCAGTDSHLCVSRVHSGLLPGMTTAADQGLTILTKLPGAPTRVHEDTTTYRPEFTPVWHDDVALIEVAPDRADVTADVVAAAFAAPPSCNQPVALVVRRAAAFYLIGREPALDPADSAFDAEGLAAAKQLWQGLRALPSAQAMSRLEALRHAALTCAPTDGLLSR